MNSKWIFWDAWVRQQQWLGLCAAAVEAASWLWSRPEANRRQADLDGRRRGEFFDVLVQQADEARTRVREGSTWQGMPLLGAFSFAAQKMPSRRKALRCGGEGKEQQQKHFGTPTKASTGECYRTGGRAAPWFSSNTNSKANEQAGKRPARATARATHERRAASTAPERRAEDSPRRPPAAAGGAAAACLAACAAVFSPWPSVLAHFSESDLRVVHPACASRRGRWTSAAYFSARFSRRSRRGAFRRRSSINLRRYSTYCAVDTAARTRGRLSSCRCCGSARLSCYRVNTGLLPIFSGRAHHCSALSAAEAAPVVARYVVTVQQTVIQREKRKVATARANRRL